MTADKEETKDIWKAIKAITENMQEVANRLNDIADRFNKYKWINECKGEISQSVFSQVKSRLRKEINEGLSEALEDADIRQKLKGVVEEVLRDSMSPNALNPAVV